MDFQFDPTFSLLAKFSLGLRPMPTSANELQLVANYLGVELTASGLEENARALSKELERQNTFLTANLESESIYHADDYVRSKFIRDIVANNRTNRAKRLAGDR